jgi:hypothetical protein
MRKSMSRKLPSLVKKNFTPEIFMEYSKKRSLKEKWVLYLKTIKKFMRKLGLF